MFCGHASCFRMKYSVNETPNSVAEGKCLTSYGGEVFDNLLKIPGLRTAWWLWPQLSSGWHRLVNHNPAPCQLSTGRKKKKKKPYRRTDYLRPMIRSQFSLPPLIPCLLTPTGRGCTHTLHFHGRRKPPVPAESSLHTQCTLPVDASAGLVLPRVSAPRAKGHRNFPRYLLLYFLSH